MKITDIPSKSPTRVVEFPRLDGGLNLWELDYRLDSNQSPDMKNLWWQDGLLQCRDGQVYLYGPNRLTDVDTGELYDDPAWNDLGVGYTCAPELFWGNAFFHISDKIYRLDAAEESHSMVEVTSGVPENRGTFIRYNEYLYYKNRGGFIRISYDREKDEFAVSNVLDIAYSPIILLNADPSTGSGDMYQPENRLSAKKTVRYNASETQDIIKKYTAGDTKTYSLGVTYANDHLTRVKEVYTDSTLVSKALYTVDIEAGTVTFDTAVPHGTTVSFVVAYGTVLYKLPAKDVDSVLSVKVDGKTLTYGTDYAVSTAGESTVVFLNPPPVHDPPVNNTVEITYAKDNDDALKAIMDSPYAAVYGGAGNNVCMVVGGPAAQPNAFFWNGNDSYGMNDAYWPITFYQLAGDAKDGVTGFGVQYGTLIVLKEKSVGKASMSVESLDGRDSLLLNYEEINSRIGCDLPWTIQLIENNVVFCNSSGGVYMVLESTSALENNIVNISRNVNGTDQRVGLLNAIRGADKNDVCSFDDDNRYWVCAGGKVYAWDYLLSSWKSPSWFYFDSIPGIAYLRNNEKSYHLSKSGRVTKFSRGFMDYDGPIEKVYQFPTQFFGTYDRLKDVLHVVFSVRSDTDTEISILYLSDYETRYDPTKIQSRSWKMCPRNLSYRFLAVQKFAYSAKRSPGCRHVKHFAMKLSNNTAAQDLAILSAQIYFRYSGRDR